MASLKSLTENKVPPNVRRIMAECEKKRPEEDTYLTSRQLGERLNVSPTTLRVYACSYSLKEYRAHVGANVYWGSPKDIKVLREKLNG